MNVCDSSRSDTLSAKSWQGSRKQQDKSKKKNHLQASKYEEPGFDSGSCVTQQRRPGARRGRHRSVLALLVLAGLLLGGREDGWPDPVHLLP